ncbi:MAG: nucleoside-triphosphatase, partial [Candidatus Scalindua sp.]
ENNIIILDEIGKMECFSPTFKQATTNALNASNMVIGTITLGGDDFIREIKKRGNMEISEVSVYNRTLLPSIILRKISNFLNTR